jgi:hypothetical protein
MFDNTKTIVYFNENIRCFYDGTIEQLKNKIKELENVILELNIERDVNSIINK